jgi:hypothetical protein
MTPDPLMLHPKKARGGMRRSGARARMLALAARRSADATRRGYARLRAGRADGAPGASQSLRGGQLRRPRRDGGGGRPGGDRGDARRGGCECALQRRGAPRPPHPVRSAALPPKTHTARSPHRPLHAA